MNRVPIELAGKKIEFEITNLVDQANSASIVTCGGTTVLTTVVMSKYAKEELDFFPLTVEYEERYYAAGKIKGPRYIKRETRPSDEAICNARMIDRSIRPLFPMGLKKEVQVVVTVLSWDAENDPDILGLLGASTALSISNIPWDGPIGAIRIGKIGDRFLLNPTYQEKEKSEMDVVFSGVRNGNEILINMIEGDFSESKEEEILKAYRFSIPFLSQLIHLQEELKNKFGKEKERLEIEEDEELKKRLLDKFRGKIEEALTPKTKVERAELLDAILTEATEFLNNHFPEKTKFGLQILREEYKAVLERNILNKGLRPDGRRIDEIRDIFCEVGVLPRTHGSAIFGRGLTKSLSILTLGAPGDAQLLEGMEITGKKRFMHHYNFPPYSTGEVRPMRGPGRREIGHGMLVERAILPIIPSFDDFPYAIRIVSEILSSNGSTSMASVCSSSLALMDAGVPIKNPAAGISIGFIGDHKRYKILTDIQGPEDFFGCMDFKIAGTKEGVTAIQLDVKMKGISKEILEESLERAKLARIKILREMENTLAKPREKVSIYAPKVFSVQINPQKIREVIGPGGRVINEIISECGVSIDIEETGKIFVTAEKEEAGKKAIAWIKNITREIRKGEVFHGKVKRILNFGVIVEIVPGQEGLLHISKFKQRGKGKPVMPFRVGDLIPVRVDSIDELGRINLRLAE